jgi:hypothetical protein
MIGINRRKEQKDTFICAALFITHRYMTFNAVQLLYTYVFIYFPVFDSKN